MTRTFPTAVGDGWLVDLLGREVRIAFGQVDEFAVAALGVRAAEIEALVPAVRTGRQVHPSASRLLAEVPGEEVLFFVCFDLFDVMAAADSPFAGGELPDDLRAPVVQSLSRTGNRYRLGWRYDLGSPYRLGRRLANRPR
ncbi:MAG: hypothetical protein NXI31_12995 [bacterium]|nr:hypothetical protein [bacterium]